ncbi:MAG: RdgB/HAM1 family non-canonical purine NTP pyrophosphatase [Actinobacteria bacterium]|nr:RdgB/HAM1 family non-canonical purine NTP pyrophosphatase [Actinomycetota bacterium]
MGKPVPVVIATRNRGKVAEFARLLGARFQVEPLPAACSTPAETGSSFAENALIKARHAFQCLGGERAVLADDSGIEVFALGGRPGVESARFAGVGAGDAANVAKLLAELAPHADRRARFVCVLALLLPGGTAAGDLERVFLAEGVLEGTVERTPRGAGGFGYDPIFRPEGWERTLAEVTGGSKDAVSHRGRAVAELVRRLAGEKVFGAA